VRGVAALRHAPGPGGLVHAGDVGVRRRGAASREGVIDFETAMEEAGELVSDLGQRDCS